LAKLGVDAAAEPDVILTHAHFDHVGTLEDYPKARFHIQDEEMIHVTGRDMTHAPFRAAYHPDDIKPLIDLGIRGSHGLPQWRCHASAGSSVLARGRACARSGNPAGPHRARMGDPCFGCRAPLRGD